MRTAAARLETFPVAKSPRRLWRFVWPVAGWRALTWTGAGAAACLLAAVYLSSEKATAPVAVALASFRGARDLNQSFHAPTRSPLTLQIDVSDSPSIASYGVDVVTASGKRVWTGAPQLRSGKWEAAVSPGLSKRLYWVRLYVASSAELLSEYALRVD